MSTHNYFKPAGDYNLVRVKGKLAQILEPEVLGRILSILELQFCNEGEAGPEARALWDKLYRSQPYHSATSDPDGSYWCQDKYIHPVERHKHFLWAGENGHLGAPVGQFYSHSLPQEPR